MYYKLVNDASMKQVDVREFPILRDEDSSTSEMSGELTLLRAFEWLLSKIVPGALHMPFLPEFGRMYAQIQQTLNGLTNPHYPRSCLRHAYSSACHPFFAAVYQKAVEIDKELADLCLCCIIM